uniref:Arylsulfatase 3 n=1 Tax=Psylliodes chrysocephalus TaxID=3402493 RepID=A0A384X565_9CUCU|nr:arylsulfatase 3 [Psylliodes chrysocephala]
MWLSTSAVFVLFSQISVAITENTKSEKKPHIIIILADDVGWNDFSLHGSNQIPTPNIDALGFNGVILDKFYTQQTCTPSRAALLTGKYPMRLGLQGTPIDAGENRSLPFNTPTMAEHLKKLGYSTHLVGKWHLGAACKKHTPTKRGFDTHFGYWEGYVGYFSYEINVTSPIDAKKNFSGFDLHDGFQPQWQLQGQYATELFAKKSLDIIEKHDTSKPLFLMLSHLAGHTGHDGTELGVPNKTRTDEVYSYIKGSERRSYADLINIMDQSVGEVVQKLSVRGMLENSIILFFSDNGAQTEGMFQNFGSSWPFRGLKFTLFEGGVRGTAAIYSPLFEKKNYINRELIHITDFLPTFYRAAGGNVKDLENIDGIDQWNVISKNENTARSHILLNIDDFSGYSGILGFEGRYKLLNGSFKDGLYNKYYGESGRNSENPTYNISSILTSPTNIAIQKLKGMKQLDSQKILQLRKEVTLDSCRSANNTDIFLCNDLCLFDIYSDPCETTNLIKDADKQKIVNNLKEKLDNYLTKIVPAANKLVDVRSDPNKFNNTWTPWLICNKNNVYISNNYIDKIINFYIKCLSLIL